MSAFPSAGPLKPADLTTIPNLLSIARIAGMVLAVALYLEGYGWPAVAVGAVSGLTDHLDGYLARRLGQETALGALLDQAADSFTTAILLAMLVVAAGAPFAFLAIFLLREFWVGAVRRYGAARGLEIPSNALGKWATAVLYVAILAAGVAALPEVPAALAGPLHSAGLTVIGAGLAMSCFAAWRYTAALTGSRA
ncbi:MAG TPA: CDP-alcohol phosphatidyltransferase family protein [Burkholderiales bacterium]|nr:CDP-alcohol phosphatidyltransferase family protein [Burkholderiales bacterium]